MKKYLAVILLFLFTTVASAQENQHNKYYDYSVAFIFISGDSSGSAIDFKWYNTNHDTVNLVKHFNSNFVYPQFCKEEEIDGSFYFKVYVDSTGKITTIETLKGIAPCANLVSKQLQKVLAIGLLVDRKKYPYEYFVLRLAVKKYQY